MYQNIMLKVLLRNGILLFFLCICQPLFSQYSLSGRVINADDKKPLDAVSVFLSNTSIGIYTNKDGRYLLPEFPAGKFKLVVSLIGYQTYTKLISSKDIPGELNIELKPDSGKLPEVILESSEVYGWEKWGTLFTEFFIGTSSYSKQCDLKNPEAIKFRFSKTKNTLYAVARVPLIIENRALGYEINYKLEDFEYDFSKKVVTYNGYPFFKDLSQTYPSKAKRWKEARMEVYYGSVMHFMRSLFTHKLAEEGYEVRSLALIPNFMKERAKALLKSKESKIRGKTDSSYEFTDKAGIRSIDDYGKGTLRLVTNATDSTAYYKKYLKQADWIVSNELFKTDSSFCFSKDSLTLAVFSSDSIEIRCLRKEVPLEYKRTGIQHRFEKVPVTQFTFINHKPIFVMTNGFYYGPYDLKITGFWAWWETLSTLIPFDYFPPK
jgi:hypothetical protein